MSNRGTLEKLLIKAFTHADYSGSPYDEFESFGSCQCGVGPTEHRPKLEASIFPGACVCRPVDRKEVKANQAAEKAMHQEWIAHGRARRGVRITHERGKRSPRRQEKPNKKYTLA